MVLLTEELEKKNVIIQQLCLNEETNINKIDNLVCELKEFRGTTFSNMASVRNDLDEKEKANSKLNERIASLENEYHSKIEEVECLKSEKSKIVDDLKNKDMELHELVEKTNKEMSLKMTAMEEIEIQRNILNDELNITKMELQNMEHKIELQNINFEELDKRTKRVSELSELLETSQQELNLKTERYQSLSNEMTTLTNSISNLESHNLAVWEDNQLIQKQLVELQEESKNQIDKLMNALKEAGIEAEAHHEQMNVIEQELALLKEEQKENDSLQDLIALKDQELSEVLQNLGSKTDSYLDCLNELEKTKLEVSKLEVLNEEKNESLATLNKHFLNAKAALIQANTENNAIEKLKSLLEMEKSAKITLETRIESMGLEISSLKAVLQEKHQEITQLTEEKFKVVEDMQCEITRLVKEKQQEMALLIEKNQHEISLVMEVKEKGQYEQLEQKQQEITQLKEQLSLCREEKAVVDVKCRELAREIDGYSIKLSQLEELRLSHDQSFEEIVDRLSEAKREISKLQAEVTNGECHSVELQQNHRTSQRRICDLELKYANSMEKMNGKFNSLRHEIEDKKQEIEELQLKLTVAVNTSNNDRIEMELQSLREEVTRLKESNNSYEENVEKLMEEQCTKNDALSKLEQELTLSIASSVEKNNYINCFQASLSQIRSYFYSHMSSGVISEKGNNKVPDSEILEYLHIELMDKTKSLANLKTVLDEKVTALEKRLASVPVTPSYTCPLDEALAKIESLKTFLLKKTQELQALNRDVEHINPDFYNDVVDTPCGDVLDSVSCLVPGSSALPNLGTVYQNLAGTLEDFEENLKRVKTGLPLNHPAAFVEISKLIQEIAVVKNSRAELNKLVSKLEKEKAETLKEVQNLQKELHSISQVVLGQSSDSVFSEVKAVFEKFEEMNKKLVAKDEVIRSLSNTIEEVEENLQGEYEEKISLAKKVENLERLNSLQLDEIKKLTGKLTELDYELDKAKEIEGKLEQDLLSEKSAACEKIVELNSKIALQTTEVSMLSNKLQEIEFELTKSQITVNELVVEKTSTLEFISKLNVTITSKSEEVNALTLEVSRLEQCASSKGFLYEIEELQATKSSQVEEIAKLMEKLKDVELKLSRSQLKIDELITEKSSTSELVLELNVTNSSQAGEINALSQKLSHLESEIVASKEAVDKIEELRADRLSALDKVVELKATNASQSEIIQQLTNQLSEINIKFNQAEAIDKSVQELVLEKKEFEVTIRNLYENLTGKDSNISQLNQEIEHLVKEIGVVREERDKYITSEKGLHQQIDVLNSKINNMNNDHDRSCQELRRKLLDEFSVEKVGLLLKMEQLESWADDDEKARQDLHDKVQELTKKLEDCQAVIDNLNISLNQAEKEMQDLRTENVRLVEEGNFARQYADEVVDELGEVEDVMKQNSSLKDKIYQLQYQHDNLKECVTNLETRNKELDNCLKTYEDTSGEVKNLMSIINDLEMKLNSTSDQKTELEGVKAKWEETETHLKTMQKLIEELQSEKEKWIGKQSEVLVLEKELEFVKAAKNESEKNLIALQDQMIINEVKITSLEANQAFLEKETDKLLLKVSELKLQIDLRNQQIEKKSLENNQLQSQLREMIVKTDQESVEVKSEITEARGLFEIVKEKDNEVLKLKELLDTTEKAYSEIQTELNVSKNENEMKSKELQVKEIRIAKLCVSLQTLEKSLDFQKMELHSLNDRLSSASTSDKVILLEHRITLLQDELRIVRKEKDYFSDNCTKLEEELDLECQNNAQAIAKMKSSINEKELQLLEQVSLLEEKLSAINIEKTQLEAHCDKLKVELDERGDIDCSYSALKAKYSEKEFQLSEAIARLRETEDKRKISLDKLEEIEKLYEKSEDVVANYKKKVDDLTKVKNELEKDKSSLKGKIFLSNKTMKCYSYDLDNLQKDHKNLQELFIEMKAEKVKFEDLYTEIKTKFNELNRKLELVRKDLTEKELKIGTLIGDNRKLLAEKNDKLNFIKQLEEASKNRPLSTLPKVSVSAASVRSERTLRQRKQSISPEESNVQLKKSRQTIFTKGITKLNLDQPMIEPVSSFTRSGRRRTLSADDDFKLSSRMSLLTDFGSSTMTLKPIATSLNQRKENKPFGLSRSSHAITSKDVSTIKHATATKNRSQCSADGTSDGPPDCKQQ